SLNSSKRLVVSEIVKFAFTLGIESGQESFNETFVRPPRPFMKVTVNHDFVTGGFEVAQPGNELSILHRRALTMVVRHDEQRAITNAFLCERGNNAVDDWLGRRSNVVDGNDQKILCRTRRRDNGQKLRGHSRGHFFKFSTPVLSRTSAI